ncbi:MAG: Txe/YoeB family addiction module toxin [Chitinophagales bacterium]
MLDLVFMPNAWYDLGWWIKNDIKTVKKIYALLENCCKTPFDGLGQPEPLKANYSGYWSRRINLKHRIVYKVEDTRIVVFALYGHYQ